MEPPQRRDVNELLVNGYFKTARGRSPSSSTTPPPPSTTTSSSTAAATSPSFLKTREHAHYRSHSRSRESRRPRPPRPTVEDEAASLARESDSSSIVSDDPPMRGVLEQHPIILEADITEAEAARLHSTGPGPKDDDNDNHERRFVLLPRSETAPAKTHKDDGAAAKGWGHLKHDAKRESIPRRRSRQDLPALQTKVPRDEPEIRRTFSAHGSIPGEQETQQRRKMHPRTQSELLSPRYQAALSPRHHSESLGSRSTTPTRAKHNSGPPSRPGTPLQEKSGYDAGTKSRHNSSEKLARPQQLTEDEYHRRGRRHSPHSKNLSVDADPRRPGRSASRSNRKYYSSESDLDSPSDSARSDKHRHRHHQHQKYRELQAEAENRRNKKFTSPLPSPNGAQNYINRVDRERAETFPQRSSSRSPIDRVVSPFSPATDTPRSSADRLNPADTPIARPRSRQSNPIPIPPPQTYPPQTYPPPPPEPSPRNLPPPPRGEHKASISRHPPPPAHPPPASHWQPPPFQPPPVADPPIGSYRRFSEDTDSGAIAPLPTCPRTTFARGHNDWLTLPGCPSFDICPSCFETTIAPTELHRYFIKSAPRSPETEVICDFGSSPWYRIAWLIIRKERLRDMKLFYDLANIATTTEECSGKREAVRHWFFIVDPKTRTPVHNFHVCSSCVKSIEVILPAIRGIFLRDTSRPMGPARVCDLRFDSRRFIKYFDTLETTADRADSHDAPPDPRAIVSLAKRMAAVPECQRDKDLLDRSWNVITQLPEFTVCEECFDEIVWPELEDAKAIPMMFNKALQRLPKASCQLYSPKMRGIFRTAVDVDDYKLLASKARERKTVETAYKSNLESLKRQASMGKINPQFVAMETRRVEDEWAKWA